VTDGDTIGVDGASSPDEPPVSPFRKATEQGQTSPIPTCPFLVLEGPDGAPLPPRPTVDDDHRCVALVEAVPQSNRQQELVCLTAAHVNCPRYLRGRLLAATPAPQPRRQPISKTVVAASVVLVAAVAASFGFLAVRGGFDLSILPAGGSEIATASTARPTPIESPGATQPPSATPPSSSPSAAPTPSPSASAAPSPTPTPVPTPRPTPTPAPSSDRYAVLSPCPSTTNCWIYTIRAGDNLRSIVHWFGVPYDTVLAMNPWIHDPATIHPGDKLRIPTPTR
jgi:hypothetical protein